MRKSNTIILILPLIQRNLGTKLIDSKLDSQVCLKSRPFPFRLYVTSIGAAKCILTSVQQSQLCLCHATFRRQNTLATCKVSTSRGRILTWMLMCLIMISQPICEHRFYWEKVHFTTFKYCAFNLDVQNQESYNLQVSKLFVFSPFSSFQGGLR